jgi:hypothetical protein
MAKKSKMKSTAAKDGGDDNDNTQKEVPNKRGRSKKMDATVVRAAPAAKRTKVALVEKKADLNQTESDWSE